MFGDFWSFIQTLVLILVSCFIYFIPYMVASYRRSRNTLWVFIINLFFGWSLIGWVAALIMAFMGDTYQIGQCPYCMSYINSKARKCPFCCEWLDAEGGGNVKNNAAAEDTAKAAPEAER